MLFCSENISSSPFYIIFSESSALITAGFFFIDFAKTKQGKTTSNFNLELINNLSDLVRKVLSLKLDLIFELITLIC